MIKELKPAGQVRIGVVDMGTNAFMGLVADVDLSASIFNSVQDFHKVVRLGEGVNQSGVLADSALLRAQTALADYKKQFSDLNADAFIAVGTSAVRDSKNAKDLLTLAQNEGFSAHIISGDREADLTFLGTISDANLAPSESVLVVDIGGGSTEFIFRAAHTETLVKKSFDVGSVRLKEMFQKDKMATHTELDEMTTFTSNLFKEFLKVQADRVIIAAGTPVALQALKTNGKYSLRDSHKKQLTVCETQDLQEVIFRTSPEALAHQAGLHVQQADVLLAGTVILLESLKRTTSENYAMSIRGLRYGVAFKYHEFVGPQSLVV